MWSRKTFKFITNFRIRSSYPILGAALLPLLLLGVLASRNCATPRCPPSLASSAAVLPSPFLAPTSAPASVARYLRMGGGETIFCNYIAKVSDRLIIMLPDYVQVPLGAGPVQDSPVSAVRNLDILPGHLHQELDNIEVALLCRERGFLLRVFFSVCSALPERLHKVGRSPGSCGCWHLPLRRGRGA